MKSKKGNISIVLIICLVMTLMPTAVLAEKTPIVVKNSAELKSALENPNGSNVILCANISLDTRIAVTGGAHVLDLNGFTISDKRSPVKNFKASMTGDEAFIKIDKYSSLTVNDSKGGGVIKSIKYAAIYTGGNSELIVNGGTISVEGYEGGGIVNVSNTIINGGTFTGFFGIICKDGTVIVNGGSMSGNAIGIEVESGSVVVNSGTVKGRDRAVALDSGTVIVNGGTIAGNIDKGDGTASMGSLAQSGGTITGKINIKGGIITVSEGTAEVYGNFKLTDSLSFNALNILPKSSITIAKSREHGPAGILQVGTVSGGTPVIDTGMLIIGGEGTAAGEFELKEGLSMKSLTVKEGSNIGIRGNITITGDLINKGIMQINSEAELIVSGAIIGLENIRGYNPEGANPGDSQGRAFVNFSDVSQNAWYYNYVNELSSKGIISGYSDGLFHPKDDVSYGMALKLIMMASNEGRPECPTSSHWASGYMDRALFLGVLDREVNLDEPIMRKEMAEITVKALNLLLSDKPSPFEDTEDNYAATLYETGIMEGSLSENKRLFKPDDKITRAEITAVIGRIHVMSNKVMEAR